jgi:hypothetical protein
VLYGVHKIRESSSAVKLIKAIFIPCNHQGINRTCYAVYAGSKKMQTPSRNFILTAIEPYALICIRFWYCYYKGVSFIGDFKFLSDLWVTR